jgi:hypothetical protein
MSDIIYYKNGEETFRISPPTVGTKCPETKLEVKKMTEIEKTEGEIKVLQAKLALLEEIENHKTPCEEAYKKVYGEYPMGEPFWIVFKKGYEEAQEDYKVGEYQPTPQEPEELKTLYQFLGEYKYGVGEDFPNFDDDEFSILDWHQIFIDYLYECCDILDEDDKQITVKINQSQLGGLND